MTVFAARYKDDETFIMASHADDYNKAHVFKFRNELYNMSHPHHSVRKKITKLF